jgi:hypothetical protein
VPGTNQNDQVLTCLTSREHDYAENIEVVSDSILEHPNRSGYRGANWAWQDSTAREYSFVRLNHRRWSGDEHVLQAGVGFGESLVARYRKIENSVGRAVGKELRALRAEIGPQNPVA